MQRVFFIVSLFLCIQGEINAQSVDKKLTQKIQELVKDFRGDAGIYVKNLKTGKVAAYNADSIFPTASTVKVPIMVGIFDKIEKGQLTYNQNLLYIKSLELYKGDDGILASLKDSTRIALSAVQMLSISMSDNSASLWLQTLAGTGTAINQWLQRNGYHQLRVNSRTPGREQDRDLYGWGQTSPRDIVNLLIQIREGKAVSKAASEEMYRVLGNMYLDHRSLSRISPYIKVASKTGSVNDARSEVAMVNAPHGDYVFAIYTKNLQDQSWEQNNEAFMLIKNLSSLLWNYFEPNYDWKPSGSRKYEKLW